MSIAGKWEEMLYVCIRKWFFFSYTTHVHECRLFKNRAKLIWGVCASTSFFPQFAFLQDDIITRNSSFVVIGYRLLPHVVENGSVSCEGLASANQSHRSHFFQWRRMLHVSPLFLSLSFVSLRGLVYVVTYKHYINLIYFIFYSSSRRFFS